MKINKNTYKRLTLALLSFVAFKFIYEIDMHEDSKQEQTVRIDHELNHENYRTADSDTVFLGEDRSTLNSADEIDSADDISRERGSGLTYLDNDGDGFFETVHDQKTETIKPSGSRQKAEHTLSDHNGDGLPDDTLVQSDQIVQGSRFRAESDLTDYDGDGLPDD